MLQEASWKFDHGEGFYICSNCGNMIFAPHKGVRETYHRYCGVCGAKMTTEELEDKQFENNEG